MVAELREIYPDWGSDDSAPSAPPASIAAPPDRKRSKKRCPAPEVLDRPVERLEPVSGAWSAALSSAPIVQSAAGALQREATAMLEGTIAATIRPELVYLIILLLVANLLISLRISSKLDDCLALPRLSGAGGSPMAAEAS